MNEKQQLLEELKRLKSYYPFRICWGRINKESGNYEAFAYQTKRAMNDSLKSGIYEVFKI